MSNILKKYKKYLNIYNYYKFYYDDWRKLNIKLKIQCCNDEYDKRKLIVYWRSLIFYL